MDESPQAARKHPVRLVAQRTGLSPHVLRAWERRHDVVHPTRSDGGQRLYSDEDIERLRLLHQLTKAGHRISQLARVPLEQLRSLAAEPEGERGTTASTSEEAKHLGNEALRAVEDLDASRLQTVLDQAAVSLGLPVFLDDLVAPLLREIGLRWQQGQLGVAQEHLATAVVRRVLGWIIRTFEVTLAAPRIVVATPPRQVHELGAMMVAGTAAAEGWGVTYLGADLPVADILAAVRHSSPKALALSLVHPANDPDLVADVRWIRQRLDAEVALLVGGGATLAYRDRLEPLGARIILDLPTLRSALHSLHPSSAPAR